jgi:hypothetical protein
MRRLHEGPNIFGIQTHTNINKITMKFFHNRFYFNKELRVIYSIN